MPNHRTRREYPCAVCGTIIERCPSAFKRSPSGRFYCSIGCRNQNRTISVPITTCPTCGVAFRAKLLEHGRQTYCSARCSNKRAHGLATRRRTCSGCGAEFDLPITRPRQELCSNRCKRRKPRQCDVCSTTFQPSTATTRYCCLVCRGIAHRRRVTLTCPVCKVEFSVMASLHDQIYCSRSCMLQQRFHSHEEDAVIALATTLIGETPKRQYSFPWLVGDSGRGLHVDAYFPRARLVLEYDGRQHREFMPHYHRTLARFAAAQLRDVRKDSLIRAHRIRVVRVRDDEPKSLEHIADRLGLRQPALLVL